MKKIIYNKNNIKLKGNYFESEQANKPLIIDIHGGGFCAGNENYNNCLSSRLLKETGFNVVGITYRLTPWHKFPIPLNDCNDIINELINDKTLNFDRTKIILIGHSAGGNLALSLALLRKDIYKIILDYPLLDLKFKQRKKTKYSIPKFVLKIYSKWYCFNSKKWENPLLSPINMKDEDILRLPKIFMVSCENDTLKDDVNRFKLRLDKNNKSYKHIEYKNAIHGLTELCSSKKLKPCINHGKKIVNKQYEIYENIIRDISDFIKN